MKFDVGDLVSVDSDVLQVKDKIGIIIEVFSSDMQRRKQYCILLNTQFVWCYENELKYETSINK